MSKGEPSNVALLTAENKIWSAKKRQKKVQVKEVVFDEDARREYLTGFRKRKQAKKEASKAKAREREHQAKLEERRERRKELAERAALNAREVERAYAGESDSGQSEASKSSLGKPSHEEMAFENEENLATVTVVEDFDPGETRFSSSVFTQTKASPSNDNTPRKAAKEQKIANAQRPINQKAKFFYETKAARKYEKIKQRLRKDERSNRGKQHKRRR